MQDLKLFNTNITMSSLEIANLTGKDHDKVMRSIKATLEQANIDSAKYGDIYLDRYSREQPCYNLPRFETDLVISGYSVPYRAAIIKRWQELEQEKSYGNIKLPTNYEEALEDLLVKVKENKRLEQQVEFLEPFKEKVDNSKVIFSKKESVYDEEKGFKKNVKDVYPFLSNAHISLILEHYTTKRYKDTDHYIKSELDCVSTFFTEADMKVSTTKDTVTVKHPCLLTNTMRIRKDKAIEYLDYTEEDFAYE